MPTDSTTFFLAFTIVFGALASYLWFLDRRAKHLEERVETLEREQAT